MMVKVLPAGPLTANDIGMVRYALGLVKAQEGVYVEIGSLLGRSSVVIGLEAQRSGGRLYCIDIWNSGKWEGIAKEIGEVAKKYPKRPVDSYQQFLRNIHRFGLDDVVEPMVMRSDEAFKSWALPIKFIFIDGCHEYSFVKNDALWKKFVVVGGMMVFHDYHSSWPGVVKAVGEVMRTDPYFKQVARGDLCIVFKRESLTLLSYVGEGEGSIDKKRTLVLR